MKTTCKILMEKLSALPPDFPSLRAWLDGASMTPDEITCTAMEFIEQYCEWEYEDRFDDRTEPVTLTEEEKLPFHSNYLCPIMELLLEYGLQPNGIYNKESLFTKLRYVTDNRCRSWIESALVVGNDHSYGRVTKKFKNVRSADTNNNRAYILRIFSVDILFTSHSKGTVKVPGL